MKNKIFKIITIFTIFYSLTLTADKKLNLKLSHAVDANKTKTAAKLIKAGADVNHKDYDGWPIFITAVNSKNKGMLSLFIRNRVNVNISGPDKRTPLMHAIENKNEFAIKKLMNAGADINAVDNRGQTILMYAARKGDVRLVKFLINKGVNIYAKDKAGRNALSHAVQFRKRDVIRILGDYETRPDEFLIAVETGNTINTRRIISKGIDVNIKNARGEPALFIAVRRNDMTMARLLINNGADINFTNKSGHTVLMYTIAENKFRMARLLLRNGARANFNFIYSDGLTALMRMLKNRERMLAKLILKHKQNLDIQDKEGNTALMYASVLGMSDIVRTLLKKGADPLIVRKDKITAYDIASRKGHSFIKRILKESMEKHMVD
ncbi:MAG: ankyrin repeat domain-containing protein [bacterium]